jgi:hypothetical protein
MLGKAPQDRFGVGCPKPQRRGQFDELVVLLFDDLPVDRPGQNCLKIGILLSIGRPLHLGRVDGEARSLPCEGEPERMRFASRADSFGRTHQDDSERSPGRRANEAVRDGASALRNWRLQS